MSLNPSIPAACRAALRRGDAASEHARSCSFCAQRFAAQDALAAFARQRPASPEALRAPAFLEGVYERAVEHAEQGPISTWLDEAPAPADAVPVDGAPRRWEDAFTESQTARELVQRPASPGPEAWSGVRRNVLDAVAQEASSRRRSFRGWRGALAGAAAAAILVAISVSDGTPEEPKIVFTELGEVPDVPFAIVRYGARD